MVGPLLDDREWVEKALSQLPRVVNEDVEGRLEQVLQGIQSRMQADLEGHALAHEAELDEDDGWDLLAAIEGWAALASRAVAQVYAPASPFPKGAAGWGKSVVKRLRRIAGHLRGSLAAAARAVGADAFNVSIGYPWGISVGLQWPVVGSGSSASDLTADVRAALESFHELDELLAMHRNRVIVLINRLYKGHR